MTEQWVKTLEQFYEAFSGVMVRTIASARDRTEAKFELKFSDVERRLDALEHRNETDATVTRFPSRTGTR